MDDPLGKKTGSTTPESSAGLLPEVYDELRRLARGMMSAEAAPQTLTATALVHEAWLRVSKDDSPLWENRRHFFGAAAQAMRRILVERARARQRIKRGGVQERVELEDDMIVSPGPDEELLAIHDALARLSVADSVAAEVVHLRYFAGLTWSDMADITGISERELGRQWEYARAWLKAEMES
jgi:RNA polymerase sigma factor (TIGR02999 family)